MAVPNQMIFSHHHTIRKIRCIYLFILEYPIPNQTQNKRTHMPNDPDSELDAILAYAQAAFTFIQSQAATITALEAASNNPSNTASPDLQAKIDAVVAFQNANPIPAAPATVTPPATTPPAAPTS